MSAISKHNAKQKKVNNEWYHLRSALSYCNWAIFLMLLGGREAGKSYAVTNFYVDQFVRLGRPFYWLRLSDASKKKLLQNNAEKLIDPDIRRKYDLDLVTNGDCVYSVTREEVEHTKRDGTIEKELVITDKKLMARVMDLSTFYNDKGSGLFDKDFLDDPNMYYNICLDEMNREQNEKKTFDIVYAFTNQLENLVRSTKTRVRVICIGNTLEEASDILCAFNFIPDTFGRFKLKKKRCVIEYIEPSEKYLTRRKGTIADILMPNASTFTNKINTDTTLINKKRLTHASHVIMFKKEQSTWFTVWDSSVIKKYNGENCTLKVPMRPYLDALYNKDAVATVISLFDTRSYSFANLITFKEFQKELELLKPRKG